MILKSPYKATLSHRKKANLLLSIAFITPLAALVISVTLIPIITAVQWSLHNTSYARMLDFIRLGNYVKIFTTGSGWISIINSLWYVLSSLVVTLLLGIILAVLLNRKFPLRTIFRTVIIMPWVISQTITALLWRWIYNGSYGILTYVFEKIFSIHTDFLSQVWPARLSLLITNVWNTMPVSIILMLAALQSIPIDIYEAARVDGANVLDRFFRITLPLLKPTITVTIIMQSIEYFSMVTVINNLTSGGPFKATQTLSVYAYREGFVYFNTGVSSAISVIILLCNVVFTLFFIHALRRNSAIEDVRV
jgi:multiple sugar transport system permease protein